MLARLRTLIQKHREIINYLVFGLLTTLVNYIVYYPMYNLLVLPAALCNAIAWLCAVVFAFFTNKRFVFCSKDWTANTVMPELLKFSACRVGSGLIETVLLLVSVDLLFLNGNIWKLITSILVVILNYIGSKWLVFRN